MDLGFTIDLELVTIGGILLILFLLMTSSEIEEPKSEGDLATVVKLEGKCENGEDGMSLSCSECFVTFRFESKKEVRLKVPADAYGFIKTGDKGRLYYKGESFKRFIRQ